MGDLRKRSQVARSSFFCEVYAAARSDEKRYERPSGKEKTAEKAEFTWK